MKSEIEIVREIAEKVKNPVDVKAISMQPDNADPFPPNHHSWRDISLAGGYSSVVSFYNEMHAQFPDENWDLFAHEYIKKIVKSIEKEGINDYSLFSGISGTCCAISEASQEGTRYQKILQVLNERLIDNIEQKYFSLLRRDIYEKKSSSVFLYDLVQGIVGIGLYFLTNLHHIPFHLVLKELIKLLIKRCDPIPFRGIEVPGWYIPLEHQFTEQDQQNYPTGNFNLGLAHGIPGILAFFSLAMLKGIELPGQKERMIQIAAWLRSHAVLQNGHLMWPERLTFEGAINQKENRIQMQRMGWCYGKPGILRSLYLAGIALKNDELKKHSQTHFKDIFKVSENEWYLPAPTFCHGLVGLYMITRNMARDTQDKELLSEALKLKKRLMSFYNEKTPFGFQDLEPMAFDRETRSVNFVSLNKVGLANGALGIALALLDSQHGSKTKWDALFLIS